jgi:ABC-type Fe3+/spermidine/putrescine transport system ATPase subunit
LYYRPQTDFVAKFIGKINSLPAVVQPGDGDALVLNLFNHAYAVSGCGREVVAGEQVRVFIRPELVELTGDPAQGDFPATVKERTFLGEKVEYVLEAGGERLAATAFASAVSGLFAPTETIGIRLQPAHLMMLPEER